MTKHKGDYLNQSGFHYVPPYETVLETAERLARSEQQNWPGSISIHGHLRGKAIDRRPQNAEPRTERQSVLVFDAEFGRMRRESITVPKRRDQQRAEEWMGRMRWDHLELLPTMASRNAFQAS